MSVAIWESYGQYLGNEYDEPRNAGGARREWRDFGVLFGAQLRAKHGGGEVNDYMTYCTPPSA